MSLMIAFVKRTVVCLIALALVYVVPTLANPNSYPQFAQRQVDPAIPMLVDVRSVEEYNAAHLPKAKSIPLEALPRRMAEIPRDIPVVLY